MMTWSKKKKRDERRKDGRRCFARLVACDKEGGGRGERGRLKERGVERHSFYTM
jgi:hypothetical protein